MPLQETSGAASYDAFGGGVAAVPNYIEECFSTTLYTGNGSTQTITNGIDLAGKGGLTWIKVRDYADSHRLFDTSRGVGKYLVTTGTFAETTNAASVTAFNSNGFSLGDFAGTNGTAFGSQYASWTFRKQPKFFDVVTYTGDGVAGRQIAHSLGSAPGAIIVKNTNVARDWAVWHRSLADGTYLKLNTTDAAITNTSFQVFGDASGQTSSVFTVGKTGSGVNGLTNANASGETYVAYIFAHNAGGFGLTGTDNVISCGSYTGNGSATGPSINLGYEPQWVLIKRATGGTGNWYLFDNMRGMTANAGANANYLYPNLSNAEVVNSDGIAPSATGFTLTSASDVLNGSGFTYIYIAIRRGPMKVPTSGASVFSPITTSGSSGTVLSTGFRSDMTWGKGRTFADGTYIDDRLRGYSSGSTTPSPQLNTTSTAAEDTASYPVVYNAWNTSALVGAYFGGYSTIFYNFQRAPSFFDEVCFTGDGTLTPLNHNLAVVPELVIVKRRSSDNGWYVSQYLSSPSYGQLNTTVAFTSQGSSYPVTSTTFVPVANTSGQTFVAYLFATCAGVSKCGTFTGNGSSQTINCGFTAGVRFLMIKNTTLGGTDWQVWDTARGITSGNDPVLYLNSTSAEVNANFITNASTGFTLNDGDSQYNASGSTYIFLAIA